MTDNQVRIGTYTQPSSAVALVSSLRACSQDFIKGINWLAARPEVMWLEPSANVFLSNALEAWILQTGPVVNGYDKCILSYHAISFVKAGLYLT